jgi:hypothetical protein
MELFRRYLQNHGDPDTVPKLENDLLFYLEVQKLKVRTMFICLPAVSLLINACAITGSPNSELVLYTNACDLQDMYGSKCNNMH